MGNNCCQNEKAINQLGLDTSQFDLQTDSNFVSIKYNKNNQLINASLLKEGSRLHQVSLLRLSENSMRSKFGQASRVVISGIPQMQRQDDHYQRFQPQPVNIQKLDEIAVIVNIVDDDEDKTPQRLFGQNLIRNKLIQSNLSIFSSNIQNSVLVAIESGKFIHSNVKRKSLQVDSQQHESKAIDSLKRNDSLQT